MQLPIRGRDVVGEGVARIGHLGGKSGDRASAIGRVRSYDMWLQGREVKFYDAIVVLPRVGLDFLVWRQQV